jgi:hypothetical protein
MSAFAIRVVRVERRVPPGGRARANPAASGAAIVRHTQRFRSLNAEDMRQALLGNARRFKRRRMGSFFSYAMLRVMSGSADAKASSWLA